MLRGFGVTFLLLLFGVSGSVVIGSMVAYVLNRFNFKFKKLILGAYFLVSMVPMTVSQIATFKLMIGLNLYNTIWAPIVLYLGADVVMIYIYLQALEKIPVEFDKAAILEGASYLTIYRQVIFPLMKPATTELEKYKGAEGEVIKVLEQAKQLMGDISVSAEKRAEILLRNAELDAELTVREARDRAERLVDENKTLEKRYGEFRNKYKKMLEDELARFENLDEDLYPHFNDNKLEDLINAPLRQEVSDLERTIFADTAPVEEVEADDKKTVVVNMKGVEAE